jgi:peptidyl-prolyl cis-trans isomerase SurA
VAFALTDPKKVSKVVQSDFGYHIIQLIDRRGDKVKVRHILRRPVVSDSSINASLVRLDSIVADVKAGLPPAPIRGQYNEKWTFEDAVAFFSDDKDTRNNNGLMANKNEYGQLKSSRFEMQDLPAEVARAIDTLKVGEISAPFQMIDKRGKTVCAVAKLKNRIPGHRATITEDFQVMKDVVLEKRRATFLHDWVVGKIKSTYVRLNEQYRDCQFEYEGWVR